MPSFWKSTVNGLSSFADTLGDTFSLNGPISESANADPEDVLNTKQALNTVGAYPEPKQGLTEIPDRQMIEGMKQFQRQNGLKVDGIMKPNGPTAQTLGKELTKRGIQSVKKEQAPTPTEPANRNARASVGFGAQPALDSYNQKADAFDSKTGAHYKTDNQGNYFDLHDNLATVPQDIRQRLNKKHLHPDALSEEAVREVGHSMGRHYLAQKDNTRHQEASQQALHSTYTEAEQNRIKGYIQDNPQPQMPKGHNSWRGSVQDMGKVMGLDQELLEKAGQEAIPAMAGVLAYNYLNTKGKKDVHKAILELQEKGHDQIAFKLQGEIGIGKIQSRWNSASLNDSDLSQHLKDHQKLENFFSLASSLPFLPNNITAGLKAAELNFQENQKITKKEIKRRQ